MTKSQNSPQTFEAPNLECRNVTVYADRSEIKRRINTSLTVIHKNFQKILQFCKI